MTTLTRMKSAPVQSSLPTLRNGIDRLIDDAFRHAPWSLVPTSPAMDVLETPEAYVVSAEVPGLGPDDVDVRFEGTSLTLRGTKAPPAGAEAQLLRRERAYGSFCRTVALPGSIEPDKVTATYDHGVVTVTVPKAAGARARRIQVQAG